MPRYVEDGRRWYDNAHKNNIFMEQLEIVAYREDVKKSQEHVE